jgi:hypothetical protein
MGKKSLRTKKHMFTIVGIVDGSPHWHGESYPWASGTNSRTEKASYKHFVKHQVFQTTYMDN